MHMMMALQPQVFVLSYAENRQFGWLQNHQSWYARKGYRACPVKLDLPMLQLYVATCSPARDTGSSYVAWGHSTLVGPFGEVLATTEHDEAVVISEIDYSLIEQRRRYLPFQRQWCGDLYQVVDIQRLSSTKTK